MIRNLKVLGLALAAVFAMSAVAASGASAQQGKLTISNAPEATLDVTETTAGSNFFEAFKGTTKCPGSTMKGHKITTTPHQLVPANATEITLTPTFVNCITKDEAGAEHFTTITMTSCDFHAKVGQTTGGVQHTYGVTVGITCTVPHDVIHIDVYAFKSSELGGVQCSITTTPTTVGLPGAHVTSTTPPADDIHVQGAVILHVERSGSGCTTETTNEAKQTLDLTVKGTTAGGGNLGITVSE